MTDLETFLAGRAPDYVAIVLANDRIDDPQALEPHAEPIDGALALVLGGADGRSAFQRATGQDPMAFARAAGDRDGRVARDLSGGDCPATGDGADAASSAHRPQVILSFVEAENEAVGGLYAEGPVVHAYVECACGARYSDKWVVDETG
ncbi:MAG: DUF5807 family protein [Halobacteriales archaeon]